VQILLWIRLFLLVVWPIGALFLSSFSNSCRGCNLDTTARQRRDDSQAVVVFILLIDRCSHDSALSISHGSDRTVTSISLGSDQVASSVVPPPVTMPVRGSLPVRRRLWPA
jgi:hypothetical protein